MKKILALFLLSFFVLNFHSAKVHASCKGTFDSRNGKRLSVSEAKKRIAEFGDVGDLIQFHLHTLVAGLIASGPHRGNIDQLVRMNKDVFETYFGPIKGMNLIDDKQMSAYASIMRQLQVADFLINHSIDFLKAVVKAGNTQGMTAVQLIEIQARLAITNSRSRVRTFYADDVVLLTSADAVSPDQNARKWFLELSIRYPLENNSYEDVMAVLKQKTENGKYFGDGVPEPILRLINLYTQTMQSFDLNMHPFLRFLVETLDFPVMSQKHFGTSTEGNG